jgi:two-component system alkaline phosphatase synthesis response regulator PhoP
MPNRILVVDDDREIARLVRAYLEQSGYQVLVAYDGETALRMIRHDRPDLVVLDLMLPDRDGKDVTRVVRSDSALAALPIIMLTARVEDYDKIVGLEIGADDYVTKPFNPHELVARIRAVLRRAQAEPSRPHIHQVGDLLVDVDAHEVRVGDQVVHLTPTEFSLLLVLVQNAGRALTRLELVERGLGYSYEGLDRTVDSHIKNLRRKLAEAGSPVDLVETVFGVGYRLVTVDSSRSGSVRDLRPSGGLETQGAGA